MGASHFFAQFYRRSAAFQHKSVFITSINTEWGKLDFSFQIPNATAKGIDIDFIFPIL